MAQGDRYRAFISYSHVDQRWASRLHRALESYRVPGHLAGTVTARGEVPRRLTPIFRDREDLPASSDLSASVRQALGQSDTLIVVCSPAAAASRWVNEEIRVFREIAPSGVVLAAIVDGEPSAADPERECFPPALRGGPDGDSAAEPVAADLRPAGDGRRMAVLKLVAGMLDLKLDQLIQRDLQRRQRRVTAVTATFALISVTMAALTLFAISAQSEAERRKAEAEDLIEFMLSDLRTKLQPVGRLDVLDAVGAKVIDYYDGQDARQMSPDDLGRRARAFHLLGEIDSAAGDLDGAYEHFLTAYEATRRIHAVEPSLPARIYEHAQSAYWVGYFALRRNELDVAERHFIQYRDLSQRLVEIEPGNIEYQTELAYGESNLGALYAEQDRWQEAHEAKTAAVENFRTLAEAQDTPQYWSHLATDYGWLAYTAEFTGRTDEAIAALREQIAILESGRAGEQNWNTRRNAMAADYALARLLMSRGEDARPQDLEAALEILEVASFEADALIAHDPANMEWRLVSVRQRIWLAEARLLAGDVEAARDAYLDATAFMSYPGWAEADGIRFVETRRHASLVEARIFAAMGETAAAQLALEHLLTSLEDSQAWSQGAVKGPSLYGGAGNLYADLLAQAGETDAAAQARLRVEERLGALEHRLGADARHAYEQAQRRIAAE